MVSQTTVVQAPSAPAVEEITSAGEISQILAIVAALVAENDHATCIAFVNGRHCGMPTPLFLALSTRFGVFRLSGLTCSLGFPLALDCADACVEGMSPVVHKRHPPPPPNPPFGTPHLRQTSMETY